MTIHGTSRASLENAMDRAIRREHKRDKIRTWEYRKRKFIRDPEAYNKAVEENKRLGLGFVKKTNHESIMKMASSHKQKNITLAGPQAPVQIDERTVAENQMIEAVKQAVDLLLFHTTALSQIPNPTPSYRNRVNQRAIMDLIERLAKTVSPAIPVHGAPSTVHVCIDCGGPATYSSDKNWYCEDCRPYK